MTNVHPQIHNENKKLKNKTLDRIVWDDKSTENELIVWCYGTTTLNKANKDLFKIELIQKDMLKFMFLKNKTN